MRKRIALGAALLLIAGAAAISPASAEVKEGWFVFLEGIDTQVTDTEQPIGTVGTFGDPTTDPPTPFVTIDHRTVDWDTNISGRVGFGKQWGNGNKLTLSYWAFDSDQDGSMDLSATDAFYTPFGYFYYYGYGPSPATLGVGGPFAAFSRFDSNVKASSIDVDFAHVHSLTDNFDFEWNLGVKFASYEDTTTIESGYTYTDPGGVVYDYVYYTEESHTESDQWGFKAGARGMYNFGPRFSLTAGLNVAKMMGGVESTSSVIDTFFAATPALVDTYNDDNRSGTITDYDIMGVFHLGERFDLSVGYEHSTWQGISRDLMRSHWELPERDQVGFVGWKLGLKFRFGGGS